MAIDYTSEIGYVRLTIGDMDEENFHFSDTQIQGYLSMTGDVVYACISAALAWANELSLTAGDIYRIDTIEYQEGKSKASQLLSIANFLKASIQDGTNPLMCGVPFTTGLYVDELKENLERICNGEIVGNQINNGQYDMVDLDNQEGPYYGG